MVKFTSLGISGPQEMVTLAGGFGCVKSEP